MDNGTLGSAAHTDECLIPHLLGLSRRIVAGENERAAGLQNTQLLYISQVFKYLNCLYIYM